LGESVATIRPPFVRVFRRYAHTWAHTGGVMENGKWKMANGGREVKLLRVFFSAFRHGIFIFGGFELGFEKMLGMQMTGAARLAAGL
jgi:hypothetical protein